jgi:enoyl-CoA hydratase/carnithine racemase
MGLDVTREGDVVVAVWRDGENRLNTDSIGELEQLCDRIEREDGACALVLSGEGKFFSNGLDLDRFAGDPGALAETIARFHPLLGRLFVLPCYTVAAINGHAFAGGAMLSCAFDHRVMREDRGYWCLNEAQIGLPLTRQMTAAVLGRLPRRAALEAMLTARRFSGPDALVWGIVDEVAPEDTVLESAIAHATAAAALHRAVVTTHKRHALLDVARACGYEQ